MVVTVADMESAGVRISEASQILSWIENLEGLAKMDSRDVWSEISKSFLTPDIPFEVHLLLAHHVYRNWNIEVLGPPPLWCPTQSTASNTNLAKFMRDYQGLMAEASRAFQVRDDIWKIQGPLVRDWRVLHAMSVHWPQKFWPSFLKTLDIKFHVPPESVLQQSMDANPDNIRWFPGSLLNIAHCALEAGDDDSTAIVYGSASKPRSVKTWTFRNLKRRAKEWAVALRWHGQAEGSRVAIIGDMGPQAVALYLAVVLVGGAVVSVAPSFSPEEISSRLAIAGTTLVITQATQQYAGKTLELYKKLASAGQLMPPCVVSAAESGSCTLLRDTDTTWDAFLRPALSSPQHVLQFHPVFVPPDTIMNILFSSGTTGTPKAIPWTHVSPLRPALSGWSSQDIKQNDVIAWPTSLGWMMGPWLIFASLLNKAAVGLFLGSPTGRGFCEFVSAARVSMLGVIPSIVKQWRVSNCTAGLDWSCIRCFSSSGEASNPEDYHWLMSRAGYKPVMEYCGGTEVGGAFVGGTMLHPCSPSYFNTPTLGFELFLLPSDGSAPVLINSAAACKSKLKGEIAIRAPAIGSSQQLLNGNHFDCYYAGMPLVDGLPLRRHGDEFEVLPGYGCIKAHGRCDDTMNLGGIKVGSVELERVIVAHALRVREVAAVAVAPSNGGPEELFLFVVPSAENCAPELRHTIKQECKTAIRQHLNPLFKVKSVVLCKSLPRNASNKVMRRSLRERAKKGIEEKRARPLSRL